MDERMVVKAETKMRGRCRDGGSRKEVETGWRGQQERDRNRMERSSRKGVEKGLRGEAGWKKVQRGGAVEGGSRTEGRRGWR